MCFVALAPQIELNSKGLSGIEISLGVPRVHVRLTLSGRYAEGPDALERLDLALYDARYTSKQESHPRLAMQREEELGVL